MAIILGIMSQFLYNGIRLWSKNDRAYQRQHQLKFVYQTIASDLENVFPGPLLPENSFEGDEYRMSFWSVTSSGLKYITYEYDLSTQKVNRSVGLWGAEPEAKVLFSEIKEWKIEFFDDQTANWLTTWDPEAKSDIPALVRVTARSEKDNLGTMTFSIKAWHVEETE